MIEIVVVTKIPDAEHAGGNVALAGFDLLWATDEKDEHGLDKTIPFIDALAEMLGDKGKAAGFILNLRQQVFYLGEILFLGPEERELIGAGRKPSKWFIEVETVSTIEEAIELSQKVQREAREAEEAKK